MCNRGGSGVGVMFPNVIETKLRKTYRDIVEV